MVGLPNVGALRPEALSAVQRRLTEVARAFANSESGSAFFVAVDEPGMGLGPRELVRVMDVLVDVCAARGAGCVVASGRDEVQCYANRIFYVYEGRLVWERVNRERQRLDAERYAMFVDAVALEH